VSHPQDWADWKDDRWCPAGITTYDGNLFEHDSIRSGVQYVKQNHRAYSIAMCYSTILEIEGCRSHEEVEGDLCCRGGESAQRNQADNRFNTMMTVLEH
jgi:hypothetical protein